MTISTKAAFENTINPCIFFKMLLRFGSEPTEIKYQFTKHFFSKKWLKLLKSDDEENCSSNLKYLRKNYFQTQISYRTCANKGHS